MSRLPAHSHQSVAATTVLRPVDRLHERRSHNAATSALRRLPQLRCDASPPTRSVSITGAGATASRTSRSSNIRWPCRRESRGGAAVCARVCSVRVNLHSATSWPSFSCELEPLIAAASSLDRAFAAQPSATVARREPGRLRLSEAERSVPLCRDRSRLALRCFERRDCCIT